MDPGLKSVVDLLLAGPLDCDGLIVGAVIDHFTKHGARHAAKINRANQYEVMAV